MDDTTVNLLALDKKYDKEWYAEQLCHLRQMDEYFAEVGKVMEQADRDDIQRSIDEQRDNITRLMCVYEDAIKDLEKNDGSVTRRF